MADFLSTSVSGLLAFQRALDTTSHNISNATTPGYSRQLTEFMTRQAQPSGAGWVGNGVDVTTITRAYDDFLASQSRSSSSTYSQLNTYATQAGRINNLLGDSSTGLSASLQKFINAVQSVADTPTSTPARQTLLSEGQALVDRLQTYDSTLRTLDAQVNSQLQSEATAISSLAQSIAKLNQEIVNGQSRTGQPPNDLLDQRDRLIDELATHVSVNVVEQSDSSVNVFIGNGQPLVVGQGYSSVEATADPFDPTRLNMSLVTASGSVDITESLTGGVLGGMLDFRSQMLDPARNTLGRLSVAITDVMNDQHAAGMDLNGDLGQEFFAVGDVRIQAHAANAGTGSLSVQRLDDGIGALQTTDYLLTYTSSGWSLQRTDTGAAVAMTDTSGTGVGPFEADGLSFDVSGLTPATGDRFLVKPTAEAVAGMQVLITDPAEVAAAAPIVAGAAAGNTGNGTISAGEVLDPTDAQLRSAVTIVFDNPPTSYSVNGGPSVAYTAGSDIDVNGWRVQISGSPAAGDTFTVGDNTGGTGDNRNMLKLADVLNQPVLNGGTTSLNAAVGEFIGDIGVQTNQAQVSSAAQKVVYDESVDALDSVSGVNLDEEAANLMRYQQAYAAAAQMIRVANTLFQSVLDATRG